DGFLVWFVAQSYQSLTTRVRWAKPRASLVVSCRAILVLGTADEALDDLLVPLRNITVAAYTGEQPGNLPGAHLVVPRITGEIEDRQSPPNGGGKITSVT